MHEGGRCCVKGGERHSVYSKGGRMRRVCTGTPVHSEHKVRSSYDRK